MDTTPHVNAIRAALEAVAGDDEQALGIANRMVTALTPALHLQLLDLLGQMALEVSQQLPEGHVDLQLAGRDAVLVYRPEAPSPAAAVPEEASETARLTVRMPESLKTAIESAADSEGISTNAWLIAAARRYLSPGPAGGRAPHSAGVSGKRITGYVNP